MILYYDNNINYNMIIRLIMIWYLFIIFMYIYDNLCISYFIILTCPVSSPSKCIPNNKRLLQTKFT